MLVAALRASSTRSTVRTWRPSALTFILAQQLRFVCVKMCTTSNVKATGNTYTSDAMSVPLVAHLQRGVDSGFPWLRCIEDIVKQFYASVNDLSKNRIEGIVKQFLLVVSPVGSHAPCSVFRTP